MTPQQAVGFHDGELAVQRRAGVQAQAARLRGMLEPVELRGGIVTFLADRTFAVITGRDAADRLWTSPLTGQPGFLQASSPTTLTIHAALPSGDPLHRLGAGQPVGLVVVEFATRRRVRINGFLARVGADQLVVEVEQAYGNCPQYIHQRRVVPDAPGASGQDSRNGTALREEDAELIRSADTFFLGTTHPERGNDASHRGGPAGFVHVEGNELWWPDFPGNNMFNSFGNLFVDPSAALLFVDFGTGNVLQLSGTAAVRWDAPAARDEGHTGRIVEFTPAQVIATVVPGLAETDHTAYPHNPLLSSAIS
jgi:predicted pyridoxine 5'-phosphate oxidase superfamily flavin-nucleotide-binding protein